MLILLLGTDWVANREMLLSELVQDIKEKRENRIWMVPELISHDTERRLCKAAGDTASRYAEVLSFTRLHRRVCDTVGHGARECLDNGGRLVAMAAAARLLHSKLKSFASVETRPEFLTGLLDALDDFKRCCISADDLLSASKQTEGLLAQKLEELSLLLETYDALCKQGKRDPSDQMNWLLEQLECSDFAQQHVFYFDGFPDFTRQHMAILEHMALHSQKVVVSLNCDQLNTADPAFETASDTAAQLLRWAKQSGVQYCIKTVPARSDALEAVRSRLFQGDIKLQPQLADVVRLCSCDSVYDECVAAAEQTINFVHAGARYRDIGIVCSDLATYRGAISMVLNRCHIPAYLSGTEVILDKSVITTVLSALDVALSGFEQAEMIRYIKSVLSPLELSLSDKVENYAFIWNISGRRWLEKWEYHPGGLSEQWTDEDKEALDALNRARELVVQPLARLRNSLHDSSSIAQQVEALYCFLEDINLAERLSALADEMEAAGDSRNAQILDQLWEILLSALEQMHDVLGNIGWDCEHFVRLLRLLLSQYDVGTIPPVLDAVMVGSVSAMRCQQVKHLVVLGAVEGSLPGYPGATGVLTDQERVALRKLGMPLSGGAMEGIQAELAEIYGVFCGAHNTISVSYAGGQPSFLYKRLLAMVGHESEKVDSYGAALVDPIEASALLVRLEQADSAASIGLCDRYNEILQKTQYSVGTISQSNIRRLYGSVLKLSASQVDRLADCRMSYFLKYGLRAKERKVVAVDPAEFGTYVHAVLEETCRAVMQMGGFHKVSMEQTLQLARNFSASYAEEHFSQLDSQRIEYLFRRNGAELDMIVCELWDELQQCGFEPVGFEVAFGDGEDVAAIPIHGKTMEALLRGYVDRVDAWRENGQNYFRIVDYKTGKKDFDYCDVFNGYGLQMLLYLFALEDQGTSVLGDVPIPAGIQYFPARVPMLSSDGSLSQEDAAQLREKSWKRKGLILKDDAVLAAMDPNEKTKRLNYTRKKDGSISGDLADKAQLRLLKAYVFSLLGAMVDDIASGNVEANPYTRGNSHNACSFCPYGAVCHPEDVAGRRDYKAMSADRFWDEIGKEMGSNG